MAVSVVPHPYFPFYSCKAEAQKDSAFEKLPLWLVLADTCMMALKVSTVKGGVLIAHKMSEGKHQYDVENVVKYKNAAGEKMFVRRGDKLMKLNGVDLQDVLPEELAQMLADGNPMLTVHKADKKKEHRDTGNEEILYPVSKESTILSFNMEMRREETEGGEEKEREEEEIKEDICQDEDGEMRGVIIITMMKTSISVVRGRGCNPNSPCEGCHGTTCTLDDVVMVSETSTVTLVPRGGSSFKQAEVLKASVENVATHLYLRGLCSQKILYASPNPEKLTIYYYKSNLMERPHRGIPVVLNLTDSNCFLRCYKDEERVFLQVETCEQRRLKHISTTDESTLSFVFYMKSDATRQMRFESVLHRGWFIQIATTDSAVRVDTLDGETEDHTFNFVIKK